MVVVLRIYSSREGSLNRILEVLLSYGFKGAVVLQGIGGFGKGREFHAEDIEVLSHELPIVVEAVEEREKVLKCLDEQRDTFRDCFITLERVKEWGLL